MSSAADTFIQGNTGQKVQGLSDMTVFDNPYKPIAHQEVSSGKEAGNIAGSVGSGAMAGFTMGGPWGALAGGAVGLATGIWGAISDNDAVASENKKADEYNAQAASNMAHEKALRQTHNDTLINAFTKKTAGDNLNNYMNAVDQNTSYQML